ncbi:cation:proton antiporter [Stenotrophomonas sp. STM01]|uniref:cation:proton antiporter n=1 Tax=Stenotrophomonas sp. STM01 TaxID=2769278 RepID=UPI0017814E5C|nr:cation:proton antiporter [Stenotrophomonas sp. STM01]MBD9536364.1 cation:proton antiporter [Stenotrophomonas sp. STM01]
MSKELIYLLLIFALLVIPRALQRFSIPAPLSCLVFGIAAMLWLGNSAHDPVVGLLATLGISSLFLFAGLEVDLADLRKGMWPLLAHLVIRSATLTGVAWLAWHYAGLPWQAAALLALALLTPSTGFIMDSLSQLGLDEAERFWVSSKAIAGELLALAALFVVLQAGDPLHMGLSSLALIAMMVGLPLLFIALGRWVAPHAPGSEFSLLVMVGMLAAYITYSLGVYYLVGAFIAGLVARLLQQRMPSLASHDNLHALRLFASFFVPFYFFNAGTKVPSEALSFEALGLGLVITLVVLPLRIGVVWLQRRLMFGESFRSSLRVALALSPTLIFTLVLAAIMRERFAIPAVLFGALLLYAALTTLLPSLVFRRPLDVDPLQNESDPSADHTLHDDAVRDPDAMPGTEQAAVRDA